MSGAAVFALASFLRDRPARKNQSRSFRIGPPSVSSYVGTILSTFTSVFSPVVGET